MLTSLLLDTRVLGSSGKKVKLQEHLELLRCTIACGPGKGADSEHSCLPSKFWDTRVLGVPSPLLPKLSLASQEQLMVEHQALGWEQHLGWGLRELCLVAADMWGGTLPMPAAPSPTRLSQVFFLKQYSKCCYCMEADWAHAQPAGHWLCGKKRHACCRMLTPFGGIAQSPDSQFCGSQFYKREKKPFNIGRKTAHRSKTVEYMKSKSLQGFFEEKYSEFICPLQKAAAISTLRP